MKALRYPQYGAALSLDEVPQPRCGPGQLRIEVRASSVNPIDWKLHAGKLKYIRPIARPTTPCLDVAGEVLESQAEGFAPGQRITARLRGMQGGGAAEPCVVDADMAVLLPDAISDADAAALPLAGMTALQGLRDSCGMKLSGESRRVLVVGASGGVGHYAVQLAHIAGAHVTAVCSGARAELVRTLGADQVIDYRQQDHFRGDAPYDIIIDCAARAPWARFAEVMSDDARLSQPTPTPAWLIPLARSVFSRKKARFTALKPNAADLQILIDHIEAGRMKSVVGARFHFTALEEAWALNQRGGTAGKIVLDFDRAQ